MYYNARWYDPALGRFAQADTIIPGVGNSSAWDRYAYALNNPLLYTDPTGHKPCDEEKGCGGTLPKLDRSDRNGGAIEEERHRGYL